MAPTSRSVVPFPSQAPSQQGWVWNGTNWCWDPDDPCQCQPGSPPFPCPPVGWPTPCPPFFPPPSNQPPWYPGANGGVSFSATPPPNPIRGAFWWDGMTLHMFDGAAWVDISTAVRGITDQSLAGPGQIGEVISGIGNFTYAAYPALTQTTCTPIMIQPGDWNLWAWMGFSTLVGPVEYFLSPIPSGMSNGMIGFSGGFSPISGVVEEEMVLPSIQAVGNFLVPTLMTFSVTVDHRGSSTLPAGNGGITLQGRRMR